MLIIKYRCWHHRQSTGTNAGLFWGDCEQRV